MKRFFLTLSLVISSMLTAEIIETAHFDEMTQYMHPETLIIVDIDDTLLIPVQTLGTDVWFSSRLNHHLKTHEDYSLALDRSLGEWEAVRHLTGVKIVEEGTDTLIRDMQSNHVVVMGLTTQGLALATRTIIQLNSLGINLSVTAPAKEDHYFINGPHGVLYREGILFTSGTAKGQALLKLLDLLDYHPKRVVFINDKKTHLQDLEKGVLSRGIDFIGLRYSYSDERVANYSQEIADVQWSHSNFGHILSDQEAVLLVK